MRENKIGSTPIQHRIKAYNKERKNMDTVTLMEFESGNLDEQEIVEMLSQLIESGEIDNLDNKFKKMANQYIRKGILDKEGNINYIKLQEEI